MSARDDEALCLSPATELARAIRQKRVSPREVVEAVLGRIARLNPRLNAYVTVLEESARRDATAAEAAVMRGDPLGPLHGVPFSIKDLIITRGVRTTWGSHIYADAPVVERLRAAGGILVGKTTTPEFGFKAVTDSPLLGVTHNPWQLGRTPGGSSGGAGAAVAAGLGPLAVGTDGGGSIRIPAALSGVYGLKTSAGRVPVYPPSATGTLSHTGPMTWTVRDAALMLGVMAGPDERDRHSLPASAADYAEACERGVRGLRVAWSPDLGRVTVDPEVAALAARAAQVFTELGAHVEAIEPDWPDPYAIWLVFFYGGLAALLRDALERWREKLDPALVTVVEDGRRLTGTDVGRAALEREAFWNAVRQLFARYDLLLSPTVAVPAFATGIEGPTEIGGQPVPPRSWWTLTPPWNLTGQPAASVPCGLTREGLPVGLQIVGRRWADATVLQASAAFEAARPWHATRPPLR